LPAPSLINAFQEVSAAGYPLNYSVDYDATGANSLIIGLFVTNTVAWIPACTFNGVAATLIGNVQVAGDHGTLWLWKLSSPASGEHVLSITKLDQYGPIGGVFVVGVVHAPVTELIGDNDIIGGQGPLNPLVTRTSIDSIVLGWVCGVYANTMTVTGSPSPTNIASLADAQVPQRLYQQAAGAIGSDASLTANSGTNYLIAAMVELVGAAGPTVVTANNTNMPITIGNAVVIGPQTITADNTNLSMTLGGGSVQTGIFPLTIPVGKHITLSLTFTPTAVGTRNGSVVVTSNADSSPDIATLTGTGTGDGPTPIFSILSTDGRQIVDEDGNAVRLRSVNWFGAEGTNYTPHGTWIRRYTAIIDDIASMGFNCIRMPFSGAFRNTSLTPPPSAIDFALNPEFTGKTSLEIMDLILDYCETKGLYVFLDHHRRAAGAGADGWPIDGSYTEAMWHETWGVMATRYASHPVVIGADVHNEPHSGTWDAWNTLATDCGDYIHTIAPNWLILVEGVGHIGDDHYWWGGQLKGVLTNPVVLAQPNKLAYSPHEYGQSVGSQAWLSRDTPVPGYPDNLRAIWQQYWGFIFEDDIAPIIIGEMGGHFGVDGNGMLTKPYAVYETQWMQKLVRYLNGELTTDGVNELAPDEEGMSFAYWSYNPNSGDTGGLVYDNWITHQTVKLDIIEPLFEE
jgi:aryl-phospho-beta-D-glucosidase BglC (GH1 family)